MPPRPNKKAKEKQGSAFKASVGRPSVNFPEAFKSVARDAAREGKSVDYVRSILLAAGHKIARSAIEDAMAKAKEHAYDPAASGPSGRVVVVGADPDDQGLECERFSDDIRAIVDDLVLDGREPMRIRAYLKSEGIDATFDEVERYINRRLAALAEDARSSIAAETRQLSAHVRGLRIKAAHVWAKLPNSEKYTAKTYVALMSEVTKSSALLLSTTRANEQGGGRGDEAIIEDVERKLGLTTDAEDAAEPLPREGGA